MDKMRQNMHANSTPNPKRPTYIGFDGPLQSGLGGQHCQNMESCHCNLYWGRPCYHKIHHRHADRRRAGASCWTFALEQNYPNPFHPATTVRYTLSQAGPVRLAVYDLLGREVVRLKDGLAAAGGHQARVEAGGWASGVYLYRLTTPEGSATRRMVLAR